MSEIYKKRPEKQKSKENPISNSIIGNDFSKKEMRDLSKKGLNLSKQNIIFPPEEFQIKKEEKDFQLQKNKYIRKGFASELLLTEMSQETNLKLELSRQQTRLEQYILTQYLFNCKVQALLSLITILTSILEYECTVIAVDDEKTIHTFKSYKSKSANYNLDEDYYDKLGRLGKVCSYASFILSVFLWISIYYDNVIYCIVLKDYQPKSYKVLISDKKQLFKFISSIIIFLSCPNPFTYGVEVNFSSDYYDGYEYKIPLNSIFTSILIFRIWFIFKLYLVSSDSYNQRSFRLAKMNGVKLGLYFPFKANLADNSLIITFSLFIICLLVFSYDLRIYERYFDELNDSNMANYLNDLWCVFITMTTVGYGDIYPKAFFGRIISIVNCLCGVFLVGLMVVSVTSYLNLQGVESNVYKIILKSKRMEQRNKYAYNSIIQYLKSAKELKDKNTIYNRNNDGVLKNVVTNEKKKIDKYLNEFKIAENDFLKTIPSMNEYDNIGEHISFLEDNLAMNKEKIDEISELLDELNSTFHNINN